MTSSPFSPTGQEPAPPGAAALLATAGVEGSFQLHALAGGANNRVFRVDVDDKAAADAAHRRLLLKSYFSHPDDPRDRLATEFAFARFAWERGIRALPQPIALSPEDDLGLYEFIDGRAFSPADLSDQATEIADRAINAALEFYDALNRHKGHPDAANLGAASEACFSLQDHLAQVDRRLQRLQGIDRAAAVHDDAMCFVTRELAPAWSDAAQTVRAGAKRWDLPLDAPLAGEQRCLSPSDFGFHNAIIDPAGVVRFFDFEYAGWDDPAKMVGDFFRQVKVPVPRRRLASFAEAVCASDAQGERLHRRIQLLFPVFQLKWCCILLNEFLPTSAASRRFAGASDDVVQQKQLQLKKAQAMLADALAPRRENDF